MDLIQRATAPMSLWICPRLSRQNFAALEALAMARNVFSGKLLDELDLMSLSLRPTPASQCDDSSVDTSNTNRIWRQHVVSRGLLTRFRDAEDSRNALVGVYDVKTGTFQRSPKSVGFVRNFVRYRSKETEELWADVEGRLPAAFAALDARTIESSPDEMRTIADFVALHFTRSLESLRIHERTFAESLRTTPLLASSAAQSFCVEPSVSAAFPWH